MKTICSIIVFLATGCLVQAQSTDLESIDSLIKKLGSAKFTTREQASKLLLQRPEAETALRKALPLADGETHRRIEVILDYCERRPLRELSEHMKAGRMDEIIKRVADWPEGKYEDELWTMMTGLVGKLYRLHQKRKGEEVVPNFGVAAMGLKPLPVLKADRITESTKGRTEQMYFLRAREVYLGYKGPFNNDFGRYSIPVVSDNAAFGFDCPIIVFAGKRVAIAGASNVVIVSGGDVTIGGPVTNSLIIARGSVIQLGLGAGAASNHIIAGKKVILPGPNEDNLIVENEPNPLGFIRWSDTPKVEPKKK